MGNLSFRGWNRNPFLDLSIDCEQKTTDRLGWRRPGRPAAAVLEIEEEEINEMGDNLSVTKGISFPLNIYLLSTRAFMCLVIQCKVHESFPKPDSCFQIGHPFIFPLCRYLTRFSFPVTVCVWFSTVMRILIVLIGTQQMFVDWMNEHLIIQINYNSYGPSNLKYLFPGGAWRLITLLMFLLSTLSQYLNDIKFVQKVKLLWLTLYLNIIVEHWPY